MKSLLPRPLHLFVTSLLLLGLVDAAEPAGSGTATTLALKKITDRYALNQTRIDTLIGPRLSPPSFPARLSNPFYATSDLPPAETTPPPVEDIGPAAPTSSDLETLKRYADTLKISGEMMINGQPFLTINAALYKVGDEIPMGSKNKPLNLQVLRITPHELTLGLNESQLVIPLKK